MLQSWLIIGITLAFAVEARALPGPLWQADIGDGQFRNPIIFADYSDPDVVRVGDDYFMASSSFNASPGLPILHSRDLVNWRLIGHALQQLVPKNNFSIPQHGNGVWAPNIRHHAGKFWIFYPDPDFGIYMLQTEDPFKGWSEPKLILSGKGLIDPTPLWDDDGQSWLLHAWAKSRSGKNNILTLHKMSADATTVSEEGKVIVDGHALPGYRTLEGPKFYKRNGFYYIFAPAGGVPTGWQTVFRSNNIEGPYKYRTVLEQGTTFTNGPHQGSWITTASGEDWFIHFQSRLAYGRITHLQPLKWVNDWPVIGVDADGDGVGNPVSKFRKPAIPASAQNKDFHLRESDNFTSQNLGLQWHWNANYQRDWYSLSARDGYLRLFAQAESDPNTHNLWMTPSLLLQKISAPEFIAEATLEFPENVRDLDAGLLIFGEDYAWIGVRYNAETKRFMIGSATCHDAREDCEESFTADSALTKNSLTLRATMFVGGGVVFSYAQESEQEKGRFRTIGELFQARPGRWVGAKIGLFARHANNKSIKNKNRKNTYIDIDNFTLRNSEH